MGLGEICSRDVVFVRRGESVALACRLMREHHVGSLVVVEERAGARAPVGMFTDRDVAIGVEFLEEVETNGKSLWKERSYGKASRAIRLPEAVDANVAVAKHVDGVLQLTLPKLAKVKAKQITIQ